MKPRIETSKARNQTLIVYYNGNQFDETIREAERHFGLVGDSTINVVAIPARWKYPRNSVTKK